jgi:hypothetical protein
MIGRERGMALPLAVMALVVIAALVACGFAGAVLEQRIGRNAVYAVQAAAAADAGAAMVIGGWSTHGLDLLAAGDSAVLPRVPLGRASYGATITRLNGELFLVRSEGIRPDAAGGLLARREVDVVVRVADSSVAGGPPVRLVGNRAWVAR